MNSKYTKLETLGRNHGALDFPSVNVPLYRASTLVFDTLEEFEQAEKLKHKHHCYGRHGNPTTQALADTICELEGADETILAASGLAAIAIALMAFSKQGSHVLICDAVYGPTRDFCENELKKYGVEVTYFAPDIGAEISELIQENTSLIFLESPGSLTFEMQDISAVAKAAHENKFDSDITVIADNTWATPLYFQPFEHGVDVSIHAVTKYIGGHSDLLLGSISAKNKHIKVIRKTSKSLGGKVGSDDCYLALRGLRTMALRMEYHQKSTMKVINWLQQQDEIEKIFYPALESDPGYEIWKKHMTGAAGLFAVQLSHVSKDQLAAFLDGLKYFGMGFSWGGFESLVIPYKPAAARSASKDKWGKDDQLLRINIGLEDTDDLINDIKEGFKRMKNV